MSAGHEHPDHGRQAADPGKNETHASDNSSTPADGKAIPAAGTTERRRRRRAMISAAVRVRSIDAPQCGPDEISTTLDVSRGGFLFVSALPGFALGMQVAVTFPFSSAPTALQAEQAGRVARVTEMPDGRRAVAIALGAWMSQSSVHASARKPGSEASAGQKPMVLIVDADLAVRDSLKRYLSKDGYDVIAVSSAREAHEVLHLFTPALVIAEIEGEDLPGYDLCARIKSTPRLQCIPVVLTTLAAYPSDYANAHSLGAVVCVAKPFRQERFGHVVRLLAPTAQAQALPPHPRRRRTHGAPNLRKGAGDTEISNRDNYGPSW